MACVWPCQWWATTAVGVSSTKCADPNPPWLLEKQSTILRPKCVGHFAFYGEFLQYLLPSPSPLCNVVRLFSKPFLMNNIAWGEAWGGGGGRIWPKWRLFPCEKRLMVEALHSARVSHIILARVVAWTTPHLLYTPSDCPRMDRVCTISS